MTIPPLTVARSARPLGFPGIADLPIGSWVSPSSFFLPVAHASRPELRRVMPALFRFPFPITTSTGIPGTTASRVLMVGTAFRGGPPTQLLGYSKTDYSVIPNLPAQPRALLEASNPSPIALVPSRVLMVGTAFRGGPPTQFLGYSNTDYSVIPNLLAQPRALLEASNPSPIASPLPSALSANLCVLCGNLFSPSFNASTSKVAP